MLLANQALNGFIGSGVPQDWATHMIGHEITAFYGLDHAQKFSSCSTTTFKSYD
jgi:NADP-dependent alcohol dehydrogenase